MVEKLKQLLNNGPVKFSYNKIDGTERQAYGTRNVDIIKSHNAEPIGTGTIKSNVISYYDLDKKAWRSFREDSIISINN